MLVVLMVMTPFLYAGLEDIVVDAGADKDRIICTAEVLNSTFTLGTGDDYSESRLHHLWRYRQHTPLPPLHALQKIL